MATVDITINSRIYKVTCDEGQEPRLHALAQWADERLQLIASEVGQIGDTRLMLLTLLMVCDELFELKDGQPRDMQFDQPNGNNAASDLIAATAERIRQLTNALDHKG